MSDITINYRGSSIATMDASGTKTLLTEGKYCDDDIEVVYVKPGGGTDSRFKDLIENTLTTINDNTITTMRGDAFRFLTSLVTAELSAVTSYTGDRHFDSCTGLVSLSLPLITSIPGFFCTGCSSLTNFYAPVATSIGTQAIRGTKVTTLVFPGLTGSVGGSALENNSLLTAVDFGAPSNIQGYVFNNCSSLITVILRKTNAVVSLANISAFNNTPFKNGGTGGTIYIPEALYNHLGDTGSLDYKAATNWSTVDGYGTITWAKIEGSYYETHYADGTPVS